MQCKYLEKTEIQGKICLQGIKENDGGGEFKYNMFDIL
jgi:hypothetical protein